MRAIVVDLNFPTGLPLDRDEIQDAIERELGSVVQIVGAGGVEDVSKLDLEIYPDMDATVALVAIERMLTGLRMPDSISIVISDPPQRLTLGELRSRSTHDRRRSLE